MQAIVYTKPFCPYCTRAVVTLEQRGYDVIQIAAYGDEELTAEMISKSGGRTTFPQIFLTEDPDLVEFHVGGSDDLAERLKDQADG